jgi:hypothetical protein
MPRAGGHRVDATTPGIHTRRWRPAGDHTFAETRSGRAVRLTSQWVTSSGALVR